MKKTVWIIIILTFVSLFGWQLYQKVSKPSKKHTRKSEVVAVEIAQVQRATIRDIGYFTGSLLPHSQFGVAPNIAGRIKKLFVNAGDVVKQGQLIALLDDEEYVQQAEQTQAELQVARANLDESRGALEIAEREFERIKALRERKIISQSELDAAEAQYNAQVARHRVALAQVAQKEAALKTAKVRLSYTKIHASWEAKNRGFRVVGERFVDEGAMLSANTPIVSILDINSLIAVIHVTDKDYFKIRTGHKARVSIETFPDRTFSGRVVRIAPLLKETSRQARVEIEIPNSEGLLKPGMFVRVQVEFASHYDATVIPVTALAKRDGQQGVFVAALDTMKVHFVPVTLGIINGKIAEVVEPLLSEWVVTLGHHLLEDGDSITLPGKEQEDASSKAISKNKVPSRSGVNR
jgi:RND family efflux transporter MFP subunit